MSRSSVGSGHAAPGRAGFSLIEMLIAIVVLGLLLAIAAPRIADSAARWNAKSARAAVVNQFARARVTAIQKRKPATLRFNGNVVYVTVPRIGVAIDTIGGVVNLNTQYGATVTSSAANIQVSSNGLVRPAGTITIVVTRGTHSDTLTISGYGRIQ